MAMFNAGANSELFTIFVAHVAPFWVFRTWMSKSYCLKNKDGKYTKRNDLFHTNPSVYIFVPLKIHSVA